RRTSVVGGGTRQDGYDPKLPNLEYPQECGIYTRFVATGAPYGPGCHTASGVRRAGQDISGATDGSRVVAAGSRGAAVRLSRRVSGGRVHGFLQFGYPDELRTAGSIPISSSSIAAHTAISKKSEIFNNFARVKHA